MTDQKQLQNGQTEKINRSVATGWIDFVMSSYKSATHVTGTICYLHHRYHAFPYCGSFTLHFQSPL